MGTKKKAVGKKNGNGVTVGSGGVKSIIKKRAREKSNFFQNQKVEQKRDSPGGGGHTLKGLGLFCKSQGERTRLPGAGKKKEGNDGHVPVGKYVCGKEKPLQSFLNLKGREGKGRTPRIKN